MRYPYVPDFFRELPRVFSQRVTDDDIAFPAEQLRNSEIDREGSVIYGFGHQHHDARFANTIEYVSLEPSRQNVTTLTGLAAQLSEIYYDQLKTRIPMGYETRVFLSIRAKICAVCRIRSKCDRKRGLKRVSDILPRIHNKHQRNLIPNFCGWNHLLVFNFCG